jgi:hypothetical protein
VSGALKLRRHLCEQLCAGPALARPAEALVTPHRRRDRVDHNKSDAMCRHEHRKPIFDEVSKLFRRMSLLDKYPLEWLVRQEPGVRHGLRLCDLPHP